MVSAMRGFPGRRDQRPQIVSATVEDFKAAANLSHRLREGGDPQGAYNLVERWPSER